MRYVILSLFALLLSTPALSATESTPADRPVPEAVPAVVAEASGPAADMHLTEIRVAERATTGDEAAAQLGPRGGFWWVVGAIVVAGIILSVVL